MVEQVSSLKTGVKYKDTPIGKVPVDWEAVKLGEICDVIGGSTPSTKKKEYWGGDIPFATPTDITSLQGREIFDTKQHITPDGLSSCGTRLLPAGSILLTSRATLGACAINTKPMATNQGFASLVCNKRAYNWFVYYKMKSLQRELDRVGSGSTFKEVSKINIKSLIIQLPPLTEQKKIAEILTTVDVAIEKTTQIIEKAEELKKGLMQRLLTRGIGHKKFKKTEVGEIPVGWDVVKLGQVSDLKNGINFGKEQKGEGGILTIDVLNMYPAGIFIEPTNLYRINLDLKNKEDYILKEGDILFVRSSVKREGVGWACLFKSFSEQATFCGFIIRARLTRTEISPEFLIYFLRSDRVRDHLISRSGHVAITNISQNTLKNLDIVFPSHSEQKRIVAILDSIADDIEKESNHKKQLELLKKGLMQVLLTGKLRVSI